MNHQQKLALFRARQAQKGAGSGSETVRGTTPTKRSGVDVEEQPALKKKRLVKAAAVEATPPASSGPVTRSSPSKLRTPTDPPSEGLHPEIRTHGVTRMASGVHPGTFSPTGDLDIENIKKSLFFNEIDAFEVYSRIVPRHDYEQFATLNGTDLIKKLCHSAAHVIKF